MGPNGSGKTTLLLTLALLNSPSAGSIRLEGEPVSSRSLLRLRRQMAVVFQEPLLLDTSVAENVGMGLKLRGIAAAERARRVSAWLDHFGIAHLANRSARSLSGGEAQRASLARAMALDPRILLLDEPFGDLDAPTREALIVELGGLLRETNTTTVLVTHDQHEVLRLADRVAVMQSGRILQVGTPEEVFNQPVSEEVATFLGVETILGGRVVEQREGLASIEVAPGRVVEAVSELPVGTPVLVMLRPEDVTILAESRNLPAYAGTSARNRFAGRIARTVPAGPLVKVTVDCPDASAPRNGPR